MKIKIILSVIMLGCFSVFAQDNPYEIFGHKTNVVYETRVSEYLYIKNRDTTSITKAIAFNIDEGVVLFLGNKDSILSIVEISPEQLLHWVSVDPSEKKYPNLSPYNFCNNNPIYLIDPDGREFKGPMKGIPAKPIVNSKGEPVGYTNAQSTTYLKISNVNFLELKKGDKYEPPHQDSWVDKYTHFSESLVGGNDLTNEGGTTKKGWIGAAGIILTLASAGTAAVTAALVLGTNSTVGEMKGDGKTPIGNAINNSFNTNQGENIVNGASIYFSGRNILKATGNIKSIGNANDAANHIIGRTADGISMGQSSANIAKDLKQKEKE